MKKDFKNLLKNLDLAGWRIKSVKSGWIVYPPDPSQSGVTIHGTPSDHRAWNNMMSELRRRGFQE